MVIKNRGADDLATFLEGAVIATGLVLVLIHDKHHLGDEG
uniref:Uncharacterized protein n=1 Tax=Loigolactobacillus rennini TaxID=238013 RepID=A0A1K2I6G8_9LACO|nr:hypothetical protein LREN565_0951 [Loigolactobacillus rennini]